MRRTCSSSRSWRPRGYRSSGSSTGTARPTARSRCAIRRRWGRRRRRSRPGCGTASPSPVRSTIAPDSPASARRAAAARAQDPAVLPRSTARGRGALSRARHRRADGRAGDRRPGERARGRRGSRMRGVELIRLLTGSRWRLGVHDIHALRQVASWVATHDIRQQRLEDDVVDVLRASVTDADGGSIVDALDFVASAPPEHVALQGISETGLARLRDAGALFQRLRRRTGLDLRDFVAFTVQELGLDLEVGANEARFAGPAPPGGAVRRARRLRRGGSRREPQRIPLLAPAGRAARGPLAAPGRPGAGHSAGAHDPRRQGAGVGRGRRAAARVRRAPDAAGRRQPRLAQVRRAAMVVPRRLGRPSADCSGSSSRRSRTSRPRRARSASAFARIWTRRSGGSPTSRSPAPGTTCCSRGRSGR